MTTDSSSVTQFNVFPHLVFSCNHQKSVTTVLDFLYVWDPPQFGVQITVPQRNLEWRFKFAWFHEVILFLFIDRGNETKVGEYGRNYT
jgi:hypothetical protein